MDKQEQVKHTQCKVFKFKIFKKKELYLDQYKQFFNI